VIVANALKLRGAGYSRADSIRIALEYAGVKSRTTGKPLIH
jgi:hypothetical protein